MALTIDDADEMIMACDRNNCKLFVIKQDLIPTKNSEYWWFTKL